MALSGLEDQPGHGGKPRHWLARLPLVPHPSDQGTQITVPAMRADLVITVNERGELESSKSVDVRCEVEGAQNKLVSIVPEGTRVAKGQEVARFDSDQLNRQVLEQEVKYKTAQGRAEAARGELEVQRQKGASEIAKARLGQITARLVVRWTPLSRPKSCHPSLHW